MEKTDFKRKASILKMFSHPTRLLILEELSKGTKCVNDIRDILEARQPNISQHLSLLRHCGLLDFYQKGKKRCYFLTRPKMIKAVIRALKEKGG